jgi:hypothetical protein
MDEQEGQYNSNIVKPRGKVVRHKRAPICPGDPTCPICPGAPTCPIISPVAPAAPAAPDLITTATTTAQPYWYPVPVVGLIAAVGVGSVLHCFAKKNKFLYGYHFGCLRK